MVLCAEAMVGSVHGAPQIAAVEMAKVFVSYACQRICLSNPMAVKGILLPCVALHIPFGFTVAN